MRIIKKLLLDIEPYPTAAFLSIFMECFYKKIMVIVLSILEMINDIFLKKKLYYFPFYDIINHKVRLPYKIHSGDKPHQNKQRI